MLSWLFATQERKSIKVILSPADDAAKSLPGFHTGGLTLDAKAGETVGLVLERFNQFRGPDSQIRHVFTADGHEVPMKTILTDSVILRIKTP